MKLNEATMKKNIIRYFAIAIVFVLINTGCSEMPVKDYTAQSNNEWLENVAQMEPSEGTTLKEVANNTPSTYDFSYVSDDKNIVITADNAPIKLPNKDTVPMYRVKCGEIPQELLVKIYNYLFPDGTYIFPETGSTCGEYSERILEIRQQITSVKSDPELTEKEKISIIQQNNSILKALLEEFAYSENNKRYFWVNSANEKDSAASLLYYTATNEWDYFSEIGIPIEKCSDREKQKIGISKEDATTIVDDFIEKTGVNWEIHDIFCLTGYNNGGIITSDNFTAYQFILTQKIDGIQSAVTSSCYTSEDDSTVTWLYEKIEIVVESTGIVRIDWQYPLSLENKVSDNVGIISFDEAKSIFESIMPLTVKEDMENRDNNELEINVEVSITDVQLGLMRIRNRSDDRTGIMVPVWIFYGDYNRSYHYLLEAQQNKSSEEDFSYSEPHPWILLAVNAIDGSVLNVTEGY